MLARCMNLPRGVRRNCKVVRCWRCVASWVPARRISPRGLASGLGIDASAVTSPTFTLIQEYGGGRLPIFHFDFYRMESAEEVLAIGWEEYLEEEQGVVVVEWANKFPELLPPGGATQWWSIAAPDSGAPDVRRLRLSDRWEEGDAG